MKNVGRAASMPGIKFQLYLNLYKLGKWSEPEPTTYRLCACARLFTCKIGIMTEYDSGATARVKDMVVCEGTYMGSVCPV